MLNKFLNFRLSAPAELTIHEHRAPTDDSIRLWKEMQKRAREDIVDVIRIDSNRFHGNAVIYKNIEIISMKCSIAFI